MVIYSAFGEKVFLLANDGRNLNLGKNILDSSASNVMFNKKLRFLEIKIVLIKVFGKYIL